MKALPMLGMWERGRRSSKPWATDLLEDPRADLDAHNAIVDVLVLASTNST